MPRPYTKEVDDQGGTRPDLLSPQLIAVPRPPLDLLARSRLVAKLNAATDAVLLCAPAGYGKTVLLSQWLHGQEHNVAWLTSDGHEKSALWPAMLHALHQCPAIPPGTLSLFSGAEENAPDILEALAQQLNATGSTIRLVIDGVDNFSDHERDRWIPGLLNQAGLPIQLILVTRSNAAIDPGRARLNGRIMELHSSDLASRWTRSMPSPQKPSLCWDLINWASCSSNLRVGLPALSLRSARCAPRPIPALPWGILPPTTGSSPNTWTTKFSAPFRRSSRTCFPASACAVPLSRHRHTRSQATGMPAASSPTLPTTAIW
jgi:hypothetical protein